PVGRALALAVPQLRPELGALQRRLLAELPRDSGQDRVGPGAALLVARGVRRRGFLLRRPLRAAGGRRAGRRGRVPCPLPGRQRRRVGLGVGRGGGRLLLGRRRPLALPQGPVPPRLLAGPAHLGGGRGRAVFLLCPADVGGGRALFLLRAGRGLFLF